MDDFQGTIYAPPKDGLPFLVVTFTKDGISTQQAKTRSEARMLLTRDRVLHLKSAANSAGELAGVRR